LFDKRLRCSWHQPLFRTEVVASRFCHRTLRPVFFKPRANASETGANVCYVVPHFSKAASGKFVPKSLAHWARGHDQFHPIIWADLPNSIRKSLVLPICAPQHKNSWRLQHLAASVERFVDALVGVCLSRSTRLPPTSSEQLSSRTRADLMAASDAYDVQF